MMEDLGNLLTVFVVCAVVTYAERALPFVAGRWLQRQGWVRTLGDFLPLAIMTLLTLHAAVGNAEVDAMAPAPEIICIFLTMILQWFLKNALLSIFTGTALYVVLVNGIIVSPF